MESIQSHCDSVARTCRAGGGSARGSPKFHEGIALYADRWQATFGSKYPFDKREDPGAMKFFLKELGDDLDKLAAIIDHYFAVCLTSSPGIRLGSRRVF